MNLNFLKSAFDKIGSQSEELKQIAAASKTTAAAVTAGGVLYTKVDEIVVLLRQIAENDMALLKSIDLKSKEKTSSKSEEKTSSKSSSIKDVIALSLVGKTLKPIGLGFQLLVDAINSLSDGDEATKKMDALVGGLVKLKDVGKSILQFAGFMALAAPLLMLAAISSPLVLITLFFITKSINLVNKNLDKESLENFKLLGDVGKSILLLGGSLALFGLIGPLAIKGAVFAGISLLIIGGTFALLNKMGLDGKEMRKKGEALKEIGISLFALGGSLALIGLFSGLVLQGALVASIAILAIGGVFFLLDKLKVLDKVESGAKALSFAALSILAIGVSLALFELIAPDKETLLDVGIIVGGIAVVFAIAGIFGKIILKGAKAMGFAALSIFVLGLSLFLFDKLVPGDLTSEKNLKAFIVIGAIGLGFFIAGQGAPFILAGAAAMLKAGLALIVIGVGIFILNAVIPKENALERIGQFGLVIGSIGLAMAAAGAASPFIIFGAAAMIVAGVAMLVLAGGIAVLSSLNMGKLFDKKGLFGDSKKKGLFGGVKSNLEVMIDSISDSFAINPFKSAAMLLGASTLILAGVALLTIGAGISLFQKIAVKANLPNLKTNINDIVNSLADTFGAIGNDPDLGKGGKKSLFASVFGGGSSSPVADGISAVMGMGDALTGIALGVQAMADLKFPTAYDKDGKPIKFESINISEKIKQVSKNVNLILLGEDGKTGGLVGTFASVGETTGPDKGRLASLNYKRGVEMVQNIGNPLLTLAQSVQMMADLKFPAGFDKDGKPTGFIDAGDVPKKLKQVQANIKLIMLGEDGEDGNGGLVGIFKNIGEELDTSKNRKAIKRGSEIASMISEPIKSIAEAATKLLDVKLDASKAAEKINILIGALTSSNDTDQAMLETKSNLWSTAGISYEKIGAAMPNIGKGFEISAKAINSMDLEKLTEARTMFEALAALTHGGDANNILSKMGESLETALENLAEMLNNFRDTVEEGNTGQQDILETVSSTISSLKESGLSTSNQTTAGQATQAAQTNVDMSGVVRAIEDLENVLVQQGVRIRTI